MCRYLGSAGYDYLGIDYPSASLEYCRQEGLRVRAATLEDLALEERRFSAVVMITVFEHLQNHSETLHSIRRVLQPGGLLLVLIPTAGLFGRLAKMIRWIRNTEEIPAMNTTFCPPWHTVIFSVAGMHQLLTANGFEQVRIRPSPSGSGSGLVGLVQKAATLVAQTGFSLFGTRWPLVLNHLFVYRAR
jgi:SAM-dependent methyltransferase